uniref:hypothetical protein n=1 Tax=Ndongobacter massiliensis TaxID=1871025 RepID=UPI000931AFBF|nr:hypothetical protein [Ndongobacter massiliensis]
MKRRIGTIALAIGLLFTLVGCGGNSPTAQGKQAVEGFFKALSTMNVEEIKKYVPAEKAADMGDATDFGDDEEMAKQMFSKMTAKYKSGEIAKDATEGTLTYEVTSLDMGDLIVQALSALDDKGEPDMSKIDWDKVKTQTKDMEINLKQETDHWVIADPESVLMGVIGMDAFE